MYQNVCVAMVKHAEEYVLYVGYDRQDRSRSRFCPGSRRAIEIVDQADIQDRVTVQSVDALRESMPTLPEWLKGTPTLVSRTSRKAMRGTAAIEHLMELTTAATSTTDAAHASNTDSFQNGGAAHSMDGMIVPGEMAHLGVESNFDPINHEDMSRYDDSKKVTDSDLQELLDRRKTSIPPA